jgi:hypothetical protein
MTIDIDPDYVEHVYKKALMDMELLPIRLIEAQHTRIRANIDYKQAEYDNADEETVKQAKMAFLYAQLNQSNIDMAIQRIEKFIEAADLIQPTLAQNAAAWRMEIMGAVMSDILATQQEDGQ